MITDQESYRAKSLNANTEGRSVGRAARPTAAITMNFFKAIAETIDEAKRTGNLMYLHKDKTGYFISRDWQKGWLFKAYPGGLKILSREGSREKDKNEAASDQEATEKSQS